MSTPKITVLVPSIGRMDYLPLTRRCVTAQTRGDFVVKILDNASDERAQELFADWARSDSRVSILRTDERVPMFTNFNRGMQACETELVTFFHDDDVYVPRYLEVLAGALEQHPGAAFAGSNCDYIDENGAVTEERRWVKSTELWPASRYLTEVVGRGRNPLGMPGLVFRRRTFGPEGFDETLPIHFGDFVLLLRASEVGGVVAVAEPVIQIRRHRGQASQQPISWSVRLRSELMSAYLDEYAARHPDDALLVAQVRVRLGIAHRAHMIWGWTTATDEQERQACARALGNGSVDQLVGRALVWADAHGLRPQTTGKRFIRAARMAASALGL